MENANARFAILTMENATVYTPGFWVIFRGFPHIVLLLGMGIRVL